MLPAETRLRAEYEVLCLIITASDTHLSALWYYINAEFMELNNNISTCVDLETLLCFCVVMCHHDRKNKIAQSLRIDYFMNIKCVFILVNHLT